MIKNGKGGANTQTGVRYEGKVDLPTFLRSLKGYILEPNGKNGQGRSKAYYVFYQNKNNLIAKIFKQNTIYSFLADEYNLRWENFISSRLLPDDSIYVLKNNTFFIIEVKSQCVAGSVDEKLQTCDFKKKQWKKIVSKLNWNVEYIYLLSNWFKDKKYKDVLDYIQSVGCDYYFEYIDLVRLGLPVPE